MRTVMRFCLALIRAIIVSISFDNAVVYSAEPEPNNMEACNISPGTQYAISAERYLPGSLTEASIKLQNHIYQTSRDFPDSLNELTNASIVRLKNTFGIPDVIAAAFLNTPLAYTKLMDLGESITLETLLKAAEFCDGSLTADAAFASLALSFFPARNTRFYCSSIAIESLPIRQFSYTLSNDQGQHNTMYSLTWCDQQPTTLILKSHRPQTVPVQFGTAYEHAIETLPYGSKTIPLGLIEQSSKNIACIGYTAADNQAWLFLCRTSTEGRIKQFMKYTLKNEFPPLLHCVCKKSGDTVTMVTQKPKQ